MKDIITSVFSEFGDFIRRYLVPSMVFFAIFVFLWMFFLDFENIAKDKLIVITKELINKENSNFIIIGVSIFMVGYSSLVSFLHQHIFDNFLKASFEPIYLAKNRNLDTIFEALRNRVFTELQKDYPKIVDVNYHNQDELFYEILGYEKLLSTSVKHYGDSAKLGGIIYFSTIISIIVLFNIYCTHTYGYIFFIFIFWILLHILTYYLIKSRYRARNVRLYINYLIEKASKTNCKKECEEENEKKKECLEKCNDKHGSEKEKCQEECKAKFECLKQCSK